MKTQTKKNYTISYRSDDILNVSNGIINDNRNGATVIIPHVCNNINLFGAGFASYLSNRYPIIKENFLMLGNKSKLGYVQYITIEKNINYSYELIIANMIAQNGTISRNNPRPINYEALVYCMINVRNMVKSHEAKSNNRVELHCPKFGSNLAGGNWAFISNLIEDIWSNIIVNVYNYNK